MQFLSISSSPKFCCIVKTEIFTTQSQLLLTLYEKPFENTEGKGKCAGNQHFLLFPTMFSNLPKANFNFSAKINFSSANAFNLDQFRNLLFGTKLKRIPVINPFPNDKS